MRADAEAQHRVRTKFSNKLTGLREAYAEVRHTQRNQSTWVNLRDPFIGQPMPPILTRLGQDATRLIPTFV